MQEKSYHLYLVRHGESIQNTYENTDNLPDHAIPLTERGKRQAQEAGEFLKNLFLEQEVENFRCWCSPYIRTRQTAFEIAEKIKTVISPLVSFGGANRFREDDMLVEIQYGLFNNIPKKEVQKIYPNEWARYQNDRRFQGKFFARRPNGESPFDVAIRQKLFLDTLYRDFQTKNCPQHIIIVGHGTSLNILRKCIFHYSYEWYDKEPNPGNCSIQYAILDPMSINKDLGYIYGNADPEI